MPITRTNTPHAQTLLCPAPARACPRACDLARPAPLARPTGSREQPAPDPGLSREADETTQARLIAAAERQHCPPFSVHLDQTGWFQRAKAAWVGPGEWPNELTVLARALRRHGEKLGLGNGEQGYRPHVTLSRKAGEAPDELPAPDFLLRADRFCLYQSVSTPDGVHYEPLACWPLRARVKNPHREELTP